MYGLAVHTFIILAALWTLSVAASTVFDIMSLFTFATVSFIAWPILGGAWALWVGLTIVTRWRSLDWQILPRFLVAPVLDVTRSASRWLTLLCLSLAILLVTLALADLLIPARDGILGYSRVFAPYIALLLVPLGLIALWLRGRDRSLLGGVAIVGIVIATVRFMPVLPADTTAADPSSPQVRLATWNLELDATDAAPVIEAILERAPAIVGLQELTPGLADAIASDPELRAAFPHQVLKPATDWTGMGLLSSWPLDGRVETSGSPPLIAATVGLPEGPSFFVIVAHAPPPTMGILRTGPRYDPTNRDLSITALRERIGPSLQAGRPVVLLGDFNVTDREIGYAELSDGLTDSYRAAGSGWGLTWRPPSVAGLPFGLLRLDLILTGPGVTPVTSEPDCTPRGSDHCILDVTVAVDAFGSP